MKTLLTLSLALLALPLALPVAAADDPCTGVEGVQELCTYPGPWGQECYYWRGIVLNGHAFC